jgi:WD40 repeat protein
MNKELLNQLPADEQPVAAKLNSLAEDMQPSQSFQWDLETQLMQKAKNKSQTVQAWHLKILPTLAWAAAAVGAVFLLNWTIRSLASSTTSVAGELPEPNSSFADRVGRGEICRGPLAAVHGYEGFLTNPDMTRFGRIDKDGSLDEVRSIAWSPDGTQLAIAGNTTGQGSVLFTDPEGNQPDYRLYGTELGYLRDVAWSQNGRQMVLWSSQNITTLYLLSTLGHGLIEKQLEVQILGTPQFGPDGHIFFYGADRTATGLFTLSLEPSEPFLLMPYVEDLSGFAFSPDGSLLAYMEYDRDKGEARLSTQKLTKGEYRLLGTLPISKGSGSSIPETANLSWSADGSFLVFEFGRGDADRAIYLAYADGSGLVKLAEAAHAPAISADGRCLAYISNKQVFLLDLAGVSPASMDAAPILLAKLPAGRTTSNFDLDKLQWRP